MKISEMTNEQAADTLVRLAEPIAKLCDDQEIIDMINEYRALEETPMVKVIGKFLPQLATVALKKHKNDMLEIVGALTQKTRAEAAKMNFVQTMRIIREALQDEDLTDFFGSFRKTMKKTGDESAQA